jgi:hypothetical protein
VKPLDFEEPDRAISKAIRLAIRDEIIRIEGAEIEKRNDGNTTLIFRNRKGGIRAQYTIVVWENIKP